MWPWLIALVVVLVIAALLVGVVLMGMEGQYRDRAPWLARFFARVARHANGDGELPPEVTDKLRRVGTAARTARTRHPFRVGTP